jgi:class 3 adenylate cyclase
MSHDRTTLQAVKKVSPTSRYEETGGCAAWSVATRNAWLANLRRNLAAPVDAVCEMSELLMSDAKDRENNLFLSDLQNVFGSAAKLRAVIEDFLRRTHQDARDEERCKRLRHDSRNHLNNIIGYTEIWLEDASQRLPGSAVRDLSEIHDYAEQVLARLPELIRSDFSAIDPESDFGPSMMIDGVIEGVKRNTGAMANVPGASVLVADDNEINRELLGRLLRKSGHSVVLTADGRSALALLESQPFDLVLLDVMMPGLNGLQVLETLKADESLRHLPVIMISALDETDSVAACIRIGADDYLRKPFNPILLNARVCACLEKRRLVEEIRKARQRADDLLRVILPADISEEMKSNGKVKPRRLEDVAVLFCDVVGFTPYSAVHPPEEVVDRLSRLVESWEEIAIRHHVEKIKTIGDAFMAAAGLLDKPADDPVVCCVRCGLEMIQAIRSLPVGWDLRVGIHVGPVVAGVMGKRQYLFDLWGDTVNTAARMESHGVPGAVTLSATAWQRIAHRFHGKSLGKKPVKGKSDLEMFELIGFRDA